MTAVQPEQPWILRACKSPRVFVPVLIAAIAGAAFLTRPATDKEPDPADIKQCYAGSECFSYGMILRQAREYDRAAALLEKGCQLDNGLSCEVRGDLELWKLIKNATPAGAEKFYARACELGDSMACHNEARVISENFLTRKGAPEQIRDLWKKACDLGIPVSCSQAGKVLFQQNDFAEAAKYASLGCASDIFEGCLYEAAAAERLGAAAPEEKQRQQVLLTGCEKHNNAIACHEYGMILHRNQEYDKAADILEKGCQLDNSHSCEVRGDLELRDQIPGATPAGAKKYYTRGCELGSSMSCYNEAKVISENAGILKGSPEQIRGLWIKACDLGLPESCHQAAKALFDIQDYAGAVKYASPLCADGIFEGCLYEAAAAGKLGSATPDLKQRQQVFLAGCKEHKNAMACHEYGLTMPLNSWQEANERLRFHNNACAISMQNPEYCNEESRVKNIRDKTPWQVKEGPAEGK